MIYSDKTILVRDTGYFVSFADRLSRDFGKVIYHNPSWKMGNPKSQQAQLAANVAPNIEVALDFWTAVQEADIVACPDIYEGDITRHLRDMGIPVFGSGAGEELEIDRWRTKELLDELGLPVGPSQLIHGINELETFLKANDDCFVKFPRWRGDTETWHHVDMFMSQPWFDTLKKDLGPSGNDREFVIEFPIGDIEVGFDGVCMDGTFLPIGSYGYEIKDAAHVAKFTSYNLIPKPIREINDRMAKEFERYQYRGLYSNDIRIQDKKFYLTDPCCRFASPVGELMLEGFENFGEIVWGVANGEVVMPKIKYSYGAALTLFSESKMWLPVEVPDKYKRNVKLHYWSNFNGVDYITPVTDRVSSVGVAIALSNDLKDAIKQVIAVAEEVRMPGITYDQSAFESADEQIQKGRLAGISW